MSHAPHSALTTVLRTARHTLVACLACACLLWLPPCAQADMLQQFADGSAQVQTLYSSFTQEKKLSFMPQPLRSQGQLYFVRDHAASGQPALLWEYRTPAPSGLWYARGQSWLWTQGKDTLHRATGQEGAVLNAMIGHILQWFALEPQKLRQQYTIGEDGECLTFAPKQTMFFTHMRVCPSADKRALRSLRFDESNGDSTLLTFDPPRINAEPLRAFPDGTPLP